MFFTTDGCVKRKVSLILLKTSRSARICPVLLLTLGKSYMMVQGVKIFY